MAKILTFDEMKQQYHDKWLLIAYTKIDPDTLQVLQGEVLAHSPNREEIYQALPAVKGRDAAIEFVGTPQDDIAYILQTMRKTYPVIRWGNLLLLRASVRHQQNHRVLQLLIDTGSSFTVLPPDVLAEIGCLPQQPSQVARIMAARGMLQAPKTTVGQFYCLGCVIEDFSVVALELPMRSPAAGLLGMDFLTQVGAVIDIGEQEISLPISPKQP